MESHPEICFAMLKSTGSLKEPIYVKKADKEGQSIRLRILAQHYDQTDNFMEYVRNHPKLRKLAVDCIDALCLAVTGMLGLENDFKSIPENPMCDKRGIPMQMVYADKSGKEENSSVTLQ